MIKFDIPNRITGAAQCSVEIDCSASVPRSWKLRLAVLAAIKSGADLSGADLSDADLSDADLSGANLSGDNLSDADLSGANLSGANLRWADLSDADLSGANLRWANLRWADLSGADLSGANLSGANLSGADLSGANLRWADLSDADLSGANLFVLQTDLWAVYIQPTDIRIGCQYHPAEKWFGYSDAIIEKMDKNALEWWARWKPVIELIHKTNFGGKK